MLRHPQTLPPEWAPQSGVMLTWPHAQSDWAPWLTEVEPVFVAIARAVTAHERLLVSCLDDAHLAHVRTRLADATIDLGRVDLYALPSNDTWARDHGPLTVLRDGHPVLLDFTFNGWGNKHAAALDNRITATLHAAGAFGATALESDPLVLEGGSIEVDGRGTLLTTRRCLLFGVERVLWLDHGHLEGDDTDAHIDTLARFCDPHTIAYVACDDPADPHYEGLRAMAAELAALRDADGAPYRLVPLPWPAAKYDGDQRLPATYANFLIINDAVLVPTYRDAADAEALAAIQGCFPEREVIGIDCLPLIHQYGSLHCVTMQLPAGTL